MTLFDLSENETGIITELLLNKATTKRLYDMGVRKGVRVTFLRTAPFGGCIEFEVLNCKIALRKNEAEKIIIERVKKL